MRRAKFAVIHGEIVDVSQTCPGFTVMPALRSDGSVDRSATLFNAIRERQHEIARRADADHWTAQRG
jgi:hypothetical protein